MSESHYAVTDIKVVDSFMEVVVAVQSLLERSMDRVRWMHGRNDKYTNIRTNLTFAKCLGDLAFLSGLFELLVEFEELLPLCLKCASQHLGAVLE